MFTHSRCIRAVVRCFCALAVSPSVAFAYPISSPLVDMVEAQQPGTWLRVNQNYFQDVWTPVAQRPKPGSGTPKYVISAWSGGGYDPNTGDFYVWGGDNGTYTGNEMYRWTASSLSWERLSLPSANTYTYTETGKKMWTTVDGVDNSPISGETFDNVVFLPGVNRLAIIGGNAYPGGGLQYFREDRLTRAGPYFFDPSKGDAEKVGGITGSQVAPAVFPDVVGGNMWENRQSIHTEAGIVGARYLQGGATAATTIDGKDVVFVSEQGKGGAKLFKYTVNSLDPEEDQWEVVGVTGKTTYSGTGVGAYDTTRNIFVRTGKRTYTVYDETADAYVKRTTGSLMYWDLNKSGPTNARVAILPSSLIGDELPPTSTFGMDYDPITDAYYLWAGTNEVWILRPPASLGPQGWSVERLAPEPVGPTWSSASLPMIYGKWNYMDGLGAFMGVAHSLTGDVWIYKPLLSDFDAVAAEFLDLAGTGVSSFESYAVNRSAVLISRSFLSEPGVLLLVGVAIAVLLISRKMQNRRLDSSIAR